MNLIPVRFPEGNTIRFYMDHAVWEGLPHDVDLYPIEYTNSSVVFRGDGYGVLASDKNGLKGSYGNGAAYVNLDKIPEGIREICYELFKEKIEKERFNKECEDLRKSFNELLLSDFNAAKEMMTKVTNLNRSVANADAQ